VADGGLARLKTPAACARLAELADHPELHHQQMAIQQLGRCGDPSYMLFLFRLAERLRSSAPDSATRQFAVLAAGEAGGEAAIDRLLSLHLLSSAEWETKFYALARTGSERAVKTIIDALPYLHDGTLQYAALQSLATLTHHESKAKDFAAQSEEWKQWWAKPQRKIIYKPRDWRVPLTFLN
jgi:HEAT repeat protein